MEIIHYLSVYSIAIYLGAGDKKQLVANIKLSAVVVPSLKSVLYHSMTLGKLFKFSKTKFPHLWDGENIVSVYSLNELI